jgi:dTMP kinase
LGAGLVDRLNSYVIDGLVPDLTLLLDVDAEVGLERRRKGDGEWNRMDAQPLEFHEMVNEGYRILYRYDTTGTWERVDANEGIEEVWRQVREIAENRLLSAGIIEREILGERGR